MMVLMYVGSIRPLGSLLQNRIEMVNELMVCCSTFFILDFTSLELERANHALYGWVINGFLFAIIFANLVFILYHGSIALKNLVVRYWKRIVHKIYLSDIIQE